MIFLLSNIMVNGCLQCVWDSGTNFGCSLCAKFGNVFSRLAILYTTATPLEDIFKSIFCFPCILCLRCIRDTCVSDEKMIRDPRRLYPPGRLYHIVEKKPFSTLICLKNAPNVPAKNFHALTRLDENRAKCQDLELEVANRAGQLGPLGTGPVLSSVQLATVRAESNPHGPLQ